MKIDKTGVPRNEYRKERSEKQIFNSKAQRLAEKEYEEYYNRIRQLSRGL